MNRTLLIWNIVLSAVIVILLVFTVSFGIYTQSRINDYEEVIEKLPETIKSEVDSVIDVKTESLIESVMNMLKILDFTQ